MVICRVESQSSFVAKERKVGDVLTAEGPGRAAIAAGLACLSLLISIAVHALVLQSVLCPEVEQTINTHTRTHTRLPFIILSNSNHQNIYEGASGEHNASYHTPARELSKARERPMGSAASHRRPYWSVKLMPLEYRRSATTNTTRPSCSTRRDGVADLLWAGSLPASQNHYWICTTEAAVSVRNHHWPCVQGYLLQERQQCGTDAWANTLQMKQACRWWQLCHRYRQ